MTQQDRSAEQLAAALVALYITAEQDLLAGFTALIRRTPPTLEGRQLLLGEARRLVRRILARLVPASRAIESRAIMASAAEGRRDALQLVRAAGGGRGGAVPPGSALAAPDDGFFDLSMPHGERAAQAIRDDVVSSLEDVRFRITRLPDDVYKMIAPHGAIYQVIDQGVSPAQAQAMAWRVFVREGVTGFTDKSGRNWSLSAYVEMAVRTASARAYNASHLARMRALGVEYFTIPPTGHPCPLCFPWQGKVLTVGKIPNPRIRVDATIAEATLAGLFHPNCRHPLLPVFPGVTVIPDPVEWTPELDAEYRASQRQRHLELQVRKAKRQLEYAATPEARQEATVRVRRAQAKVREFIRNTGFLRDSRREQVDLTDAYVKLPTPIR